GDLPLTLRTLEAIAQLRERGDAQACVARSAAVVLAGQQAGSERRPARDADPESPIERRELDFDALAAKQVVLGLLDARRVEIAGLGDPVRFADLVRGPFGGAPVANLAL